jgi:hypothetical protein
MPKEKDLVRALDILTEGGGADVPEGLLRSGFTTVNR